MIIKTFKILFRIIDQLCQFVEVTTRDAAIASEKLVTLADKFNAEQQEILAEKRRQLDLRIANGDFTSKPLIVVADTFNTEQQAILAEKRRQLDIRIANGDFTLPERGTPTVTKPVNKLTDV
ncbi:hypothetical protein [Photobacterium phosphoreum]|uniref:hypothetical protein n=1 Tax=Photobacterium phosphoreum TaxID=659 RepID=UPI0024BB6B9D|nr:hypothetical protein [Photobacterium phosphoreum]